jgi:oxygen-dependent protoporphyrinogen oxidase
MRGKLLFAAGAAVGFVLGARAGRERYEQIKAGAARLWESPAVQKQVRAVEDYVAEKVGEFPETAYITVKKAVVQANRRRRESRAPYPSGSDAVARPGGRGDTAS